MSLSLALRLIFYYFDKMATSLQGVSKDTVGTTDHRCLVSFEDDLNYRHLDCFACTGLNSISEEI